MQGVEEFLVLSVKMESIKNRYKKKGRKLDKSSTLFVLSDEFPKILKQL